MVLSYRKTFKDMSIAFSEIGQHCMIPEAAFFGLRNNVVILRFDDCRSCPYGLRLSERKYRISRMAAFRIIVTCQQHFVEHMKHAAPGWWKSRQVPKEH
jgi:hypothetical protein